MNNRLTSSIVAIALLSTTSALATEPGKHADDGPRLIASIAEDGDGTAAAPPAPGAAPSVIDTFTPSEPSAESAKAAREPYASPLQLRGVNTSNAARLDTTIAPFTDPKSQKGQVETISFLSAAARA